MYWAQAMRHKEQRKGGVSEPLELPLTRKDGTTLWVDISATSLFDQSHKFAGIVRLFTDLSQDSPSLPVVRAITSLAQNFGLLTIAEGIETEQEWDVLRELGCEVGQGYLFSRPLPAKQVLRPGTLVSVRTVRTA
ncbi:EAL domain-containing protein [Deinococcus malanensis]|nr:EAL domain-containing protein [Deinococcus malanensis]